MDNATRPYIYADFSVEPSYQILAIFYELGFRYCVVVGAANILQTCPSIWFGVEEIELPHEDIHCCQLIFTKDSLLVEIASYVQRCSRNAVKYRTVYFVIGGLTSSTETIGLLYQHLVLWETYKLLDANVSLHANESMEIRGRWTVKRGNEEEQKASLHAMLSSHRGLYPKQRQH